MLEGGADDLNRARFELFIESVVVLNCDFDAAPAQRGVGGKRRHRIDLDHAKDCLLAAGRRQDGKRLAGHPGRAPARCRCGVDRARESRVIFQPARVPIDSTVKIGCGHRRHADALQQRRGCFLRERATQPGDGRSGQKRRNRLSSRVPWLLSHVELPSISSTSLSITANTDDHPPSGLLHSVSPLQSLRQAVSEENALNRFYNAS